MKIKIESKQAIYIEVADKIEKFIKLGIYKEGEHLPSCRKLALELGVNPNTIDKAYSLLEERKVVYTIPKKGIFVLHRNSADIFAEEIEKTIRHFKKEKITKDLLIEIINIVYEENKND